MSSFARRQAKKRKTEAYTERNCVVKGCRAVAKSRVHCEACVADVAKGKRTEVFTVAFCPDHQPEAAAVIHRHIVKEHFLLWFWLALTGNLYRKKES